jgi:hypothetical protein
MFDSGTFGLGAVEPPMPGRSRFRSRRTARARALPACSAYGGGWLGYVNKDLRTELNLPVTAPYSTRYRGHSKLSRCRTALRGAVQAVAEALEKSQGSTPGNWRAARVRIEFPPLPKTSFPFTVAWTNRSTLQQVIEFSGHRPTE